MDITTTYLGLKLKSPIVCSAGPLSEKISNIREMEDAGAGAVDVHGAPCGGTAAACLA